jgi:transcription antitermination factor NusG
MVLPTEETLLYSKHSSDLTTKAGLSHPWYGVRTKAKHEMVVSQSLDLKGFDCFCPTYTAMKQWSDRTVKRTVPLFPGYVFCRFDLRNRMPILTIPGVVSFVAFGSDPVAIPDDEIEATKVVVRSGRPIQPCAFLPEGQQVRIKQGALEGLKGILLKNKTSWRLVISVNMLQRSIAVELDRDWIEAIASN